MELKIASRPVAEQCCHACVDAWNNEAGAGHCVDKSNEFGRWCAAVKKL